MLLFGARLAGLSSEEIDVVWSSPRTVPSAEGNDNSYLTSSGRSFFMGPLGRDSFASFSFHSHVPLSPVREILTLAHTSLSQWAQMTSSY